VPNVLVVGPHVNTANVAALIADAKANPGKRHIGSNGVGTTLHLSGELFQLRTGTTLAHVPYKGWGDCVLALMRGEIEMMFDNVSTALPNITGNKFRPLAVTAAVRHRSLPDTPTLAELGVKDADVSSWFGIAARRHRQAERGVQGDLESAGIPQADRAAGHGRGLSRPQRGGEILERRNRQVGDRDQGRKSCHAMIL
jgi:tripartite-type tricarboxylate transporter receptor subunit TctC